MASSPRMPRSRALTDTPTLGGRRQQEPVYLTPLSSVVPKPWELKKSSWPKHSRRVRALHRASITQDSREIQPPHGFHLEQGAGSRQGEKEPVFVLGCP